MSRQILASITMTPRRGLAHKMLRPFHEIRRHPHLEGAVYCRTCYIVRGVREIRAKKRVMR